MTPAPEVSIITVSWNVWDLVRAALERLERISCPTSDPQVRVLQPAPGRAQPLCFEMVLVDGDSGDATPDLVPALFPWVRFLPAGANVGFTKGNNLGAAASRGEILFFLNPDTLVRAAALHALREALLAHPRTGLVGPALYAADGRRQESRRHFPTPVTGFLESTWLGRAWPDNPWARRYHCRDWPAVFQQRVDWLEGAALMMRRAAFTDIEGFDEGFFMYSEELDLCRRLQISGWTALYCPQAGIRHYGGRSSAQVPALTHIHFNTSKVRYYRKFFGPAWAEILRKYLLWEFRLNLLGEGVKLLLGHKMSLRRQRVQAYRQVLATGLRVQGSAK